MKINKTFKLFLGIFALCALFTTKSFAAGTINLVESGGALTSEGLYVDVVVSGAEFSGIQFRVTVTASDGATVTDVHESTGKRYVYGGVVATVLPSSPITSSGSIEIMATNLTTEENKTADGYVTTFFLKPSLEGKGTVNLAFTQLTESGLTPLATAYTYDLGKREMENEETSHNQTQTTTVVPVETETKVENLPQTSIFDISTKNAIIIGVVMLIVGMFFSQIYRTTQQVVSVSRSASTRSSVAIKEHRRNKRREKFEDKF